MRKQILKVFDSFLERTLSPVLRTYTPALGGTKELITIHLPEIGEFVEKYGYFSSHPLVGRVSSGQEDVARVCRLFDILYQAGALGDYFEIALAEVLTKALAYRQLHAGQEIVIPLEIDHTLVRVPFIVDAVFDLWRGMPAFGLVPQVPKVGSILLFRGTDFSFSWRGWASVVSDLDFSGPGFHAFQYGQAEIEQWLQKMVERDQSAHVMGFSLGGTFALYTFIYLHQWIRHQGSIALCPPGISARVLQEWKTLSQDKKFTTYVNQGDVVSKVGKLPGTIYCLQTEKECKPLEAHNRFLCAEPSFSKIRVS